MIIQIFNAAGILVAEVIDPELFDLAGHKVAIHENPDSANPGSYRVTEPLTGYFIAEGSSKDEAIKSARDRIASFEKSDPGVDIIKQQISLIACEKIQSALTEVTKHVLIKRRAKDDDDDE